MDSKQVLIADSDSANVKALSERCQHIGLKVRTCGNALATLNMIYDSPPNLIITEVDLPGGNGFGICEMLHGDENLAKIPVIILTSKSDDVTKTKCQQLGVHYVLKSIDAWDVLHPMLSDLLAMKPTLSEELATPIATSSQWQPTSTNQPTVLVIDDDPHVARVMEIRLRPYGVRILRAFSGMQGYSVATQERPDVIICDFIMPEGSGNFIYGKLASHEATRNIPVIFLTGKKIDGRKDFGLARELTAMGAAAFITKPFDFDELLNELRKLITLPAKPQPIA